jgi:hypothetical protein
MISTGRRHRCRTSPLSKGEKKKSRVLLERDVAHVPELRLKKKPLSLQGACLICTLFLRFLFLHHGQGLVECVRQEIKKKEREKKKSGLGMRGECGYDTYRLLSFAHRRRRSLWRKHEGVGVGHTSGR